MKNEMEYTDMLNILEHVHTYVPTDSTITTTPYPNPVTVEKQILHPILLGGNQLPVA